MVRDDTTSDEHQRPHTVVVTGCAGLIGSAVAAALLARGDRVLGVDNLCTGQRSNLAALTEQPAFRFLEGDVNDPAHLGRLGDFDAMIHLASPASPVDFGPLADEILLTGSVGTFNTVRAAASRGARYLFASTSEIYGEPEVHPQPEHYWGHVNPIGPRACYDEAKRFGEAVVSTWTRTGRLDGVIARFFNTYGPHMRIDDGRVVSNFVVQALTGRPITVQGDGLQTRSFCYVDDLARGVVALLDSGFDGPMNLGNPTEFTVRELAETVIELTGSTSSIVYRPLPVDDPTQRRPDISRANELLGWEPTVGLEEGVQRVIDRFRSILGTDPGATDELPREATSDRIVS